MKLQNKVAIVTGGGRGMGRAMALRFAQEGARVVIAEVDRESGEKTFADIGRRGLLMRTDMSRVAEIDELIGRTVAELGQLDILVNNAGVTRSLGFFDVTESDWDWMYAVNARGLFFCMQRAAREMAKRKSGKIVNIASIAGKGFRGTSNIAYAGTKGAVIAMTRIGASQLARDNINVNAICPGVTRTHMFETRDGGDDRKARAFRRGRNQATRRDDSAGPIELPRRYCEHGRVPGLGGSRQYYRSIIQRRWRPGLGLIVPPGADRAVALSAANRSHATAGRSAPTNNYRGGRGSLYERESL